MFAASKHRILLATLVVVWAVSWPVMKVGVAAIPPLWFGTFRYAISAALMFSLVAARGSLEPPARQDWPLVLVSGALQMGCYSALTGLALLLLPPGRAIVLAYSTPLWVLPLAAWRLDERASRTQWFGVAAGLLGILCISMPSLRTGALEGAIAYCMLLAAAAFWAVSIVYVRGHQFAGSTLALAPWQMLVATALLLPLAMATEGLPSPPDTTGVMALAYVGPVATAFAYWAIIEVGRRLRASTVAMALLATPCLGIIVSALALGEMIDPSLIAGAISIAAGIWLSTRSPDKCAAPR